jgi:hypothetical protein
MSIAERWIAHYERLLAGSMSREQRERAEIALAYWQRQAGKRAA